MNPILKAAQREQVVIMPDELEVPWQYLRRHFDISSDGGNIFSNVINNFNSRGELVYKITAGLRSEISKTEYIFGRCFFDTELLVRPSRCILWELVQEDHLEVLTACRASPFTSPWLEQR